ncbi:putative monogalactosyldiacylglycerol synthase [Medicago truncatula]|uniref:Putative monogalactosyldiacylglycerol synthase n=1 Tax=Medicago truncatula TaxID=3880 RepID=A0A396GH41_MEDTR|nr:putative monogalactosyldiacylglycerol synthase [Medicago truncatula]
MDKGKGVMGSSGRRWAVDFSDNSTSRDFIDPPGFSRASLNQDDSTLSRQKKDAESNWKSQACFPSLLQFNLGEGNDVGGNGNGVGVEDEGLGLKSGEGKKAKKVLILMSDTGGGHRASAEAIKAAFYQEYGDDYQVFITDLWSEHTPWPFNQIPKSYSFLVKHGPLWRMTYYGTAPRLKAWEVAQAPFKNLLMMWMAGNTVHLFSIGITFSALWQPISALQSVGKSKYHFYLSCTA